MKDQKSRRIPGIHLAIVVAFAAIQIAVPAGYLALRWVEEGPHPTSEHRFSWQMYSAVGGGEYVATLPGGETVELTTEGLPPVVRGVGYDDSVPRMLCEEYPEAITVQRVDEDRRLAAFTGVVTC